MFKLLSQQPSGYGCVSKLDRSADGTATAIFVVVFVTSQTHHCTGVREWIYFRKYSEWRGNARFYSQFQAQTSFRTAGSFHLNYPLWNEFTSLWLISTTIHSKHTERMGNFHSCFWAVSAGSVKQHRPRVCQGTLPSIWALNLMGFKIL